MLNTIPNIILKVKFVLAGFLICSALLAQPANDSCANADVITIGNGGYATGTFLSAQVDISAATIQAGESFAPAMVAGRINRKSIWYKFTVPTTRTVEVFLNQPGSSIPSDSAGFTVYKTSSCLPGTLQISSQFTPIPKFGSTKYECLDPGEYYVQVSGASTAGGPLFITLQIGEPSPVVYDKPATASKFGKVTNHVTAVQFDVSCQSLDDASEKCLPFSVNHTKSTWHTFSTPDFFDWFSVLLSGTQNLAINGNKIGFSLYEGDVTVTPVGSLIPVMTCDSLIISDANIDYKAFRCGVIKPNTAYTVKLLYPDYFNTTMRFAVSWDGHGIARAPQPVNTIPALNQLGILPQNFAGISTNAATDYMSCNSRHNMYNCPKAMPAAGVTYDLGNWPDGSRMLFNFNLSNFYSFTISDAANISISTSTESALSRFGFMLRLYKQSLTANCTDLDTANIISVGMGSISLQCALPGDYVLQVMGTDSAMVIPHERRNLVSEYLQTGYGSDYALGLFHHLGSTINVAINVVTQYGFNKYSLSAPDKFFPVNANGAGVMQPLGSHQTYALAPDTMGCFNTVAPDNVCFTNLTKASYYEFVTNDSGSLYYTSWSEVPTRIYKGDANALATAQGRHNFPDKITGLTPYSSCIGGPHFVDVAHEKSELLCITPGTFTLVGMANLKDKYGNPSITKNLTLTLKNTRPKFANPLQAENLDDLWAKTGAGGGVVLSAVDTFTCFENPATIDGFEPCRGDYNTVATKQAYREFFLSKPSLITIEASTRSMLFSGRASEGLNTLKVFDRYGSCRTGFDNGCSEMPAGWYTIVSYGWGASFANPVWPNLWENFISTPNSVKFTLRLPACPMPKYNRPYKAAIDTLTGQPFLIQWGPGAGHSTAYPKTDKFYTLYTENFNCGNDTPFVNHPLPACNAALTKVAYWVFRTTQESFVRITTGGYWGAVFAGDARTDSVSFGTNPPIQECLAGDGKIQLCRLQPGSYTLVIYAPSHLTCHSVTPTIYIDAVGTSRFDHATNAYDFGLIPSDSTWYNGKPGDVNILDPGRAPSNDFFYCTTGSQPSDPYASCMTDYLASIYSPGVNYSLYPGGSYDYMANQRMPRRNLWYTFAVDKGGWVRIKVTNKTIGRGYQYIYSVWKSDVNGTVPFSTIVSSGGVDSIPQADGLIHVASNYSGFRCAGNEEIAFYREACYPLPERYYIIVENRNVENGGHFPGDWNPHVMLPNHQAEVSILFDSITTVLPKYNHYAQASVIGTNLGPGTYTGATDNINCATMAVTDPRPPQNQTCVNRNLWYKFSTNVSGTIVPRAFKDGFALWGMTHMQLYREVIQGDSTERGLQYIDIESGGGASCITPGTYYLLIVACDPMANPNVYPQIELIEIAGDFCGKPLVATLNGAGTKTATANIGCHTIGTDYGEFNPTLTCPDGSKTTDYKTTWYRLDITGTDTLDVTVYINENTNAASSNVKYRLMTGTCNAMQEQSCVQDALTRNTYRCLAPGNSYYIQVFTPVMAGANLVTGTVDLVVDAVKKTDVCQPTNNCIAVSAFSTRFDCTVDKEMTFVNLSTYGTAITYEWDFGYGNHKSNAVAPRFNYPALSTDADYTVRLIVFNTDCNKRDTSFETITIPARPGVQLGNDTTLCMSGSGFLLNATSYSGTTYLWNNGAHTPTSTISNTGATTAWVELTYNNCKARDTITVWINPIAKRALQTRAVCSAANITLDAHRGFNETYQWNTGATNRDINTNQPGYYWCDIFLNGCVVRDSFLVISPNVQAGARAVRVCQANLPYSANATISGATIYLWSDNNTNAIRSLSTPGVWWVDVTISGCTVRDSILLSVDSFKTEVASARICGGLLYALPGGKQVNTTGLYRDTLRNIRGCDSLITLVTLTVDTVKRVNSNLSICAGRTYTLPGGKSVTVAGQYADTVLYKISGCDSLITNLTLTVATVSRISQTASICAGSSYRLPSGKNVNTAAIYQDTLKAQAGCDSVIHTIDLCVDVPTITNRIATLCSGSSYLLPGGKAVSVAGLYRDTLRNVRGCDSLITNVTLSVDMVTTQPINAYFFTGQTYTLPWGRAVTAGGIYRDTAKSVAGCDSLIKIVDLKALTVQSNIRTALICAGGSYTLPWGGSARNTGSYTDTIKSVTGADSLLNIVDLTVLPGAILTPDTTVCRDATVTLRALNALSYAWSPAAGLGNANNAMTPWTATTNTLFRLTTTHTNPEGGTISCTDSVRITVQAKIVQSQNRIICTGQTYTLPSGKAVTVAGLYADTVRYLASGCDSLITNITLTVQGFTSRTLQASFCQGSSYNLPSGRLVAAAGSYADTLRYTTGCDSVRFSIQLTRHDATVTNRPATICGGTDYLLPSGRRLNASGIYRDTLRYAGSGCDSSIFNLTLTVLQPTRLSSTAYICAGSTYTLPSGKMISAAGIYPDTLRSMQGCDSIIHTINLVVDGVTRQSLTPAICEGRGYRLPSGRLVQAAGTYYDTLRNIRGCDSIAFTIGLAVNATRYSTASATLCIGQVYTLPSGKTATQAGSYSDTIRSVISGCDSVVTVALTYRNPIMVTLTGPATVCTGVSATLMATASGGTGGPYSYTWTGATGSGNTLTVNPTVTTQYKVSVADGCTVTPARDSITVQYIPPPQPGLNNQTVTICLGSSTTLTATGGATYQWSPAIGLSDANIADPQATPLTDTRYRVRVTTATGCVGEDSILVRVTQPFTLTTSRDTLVCSGNAVTLSATGAQRYQWSGAGLSGTTTATVTARPAATTTYTVTGRGPDDCFEQVRQITVTVIPLPVVNAGRDTTIMVGTGFEIRPTYSNGIDQYRWSPPTYLSCTDCATPKVTPREPIEYTITVRDGYGCQSADRIRIELLCNAESIFLPNTFTPNGDGVNDIWYPRGGGIKQVRYLKVFNRWGQLIFERTNFNTDDRSAGWDGTFKSQVLPPDVFVYSMGVTCDNGQTLEARGNVMIVR